MSVEDGSLFFEDKPRYERPVLPMEVVVDGLTADPYTINVLNLAQRNVEHAALRANGLEDKEEESYYPCGWNIVIETNRGNVGVCNSPTGRELALFFPKSTRQTINSLPSIKLDQIIYGAYNCLPYDTNLKGSQLWKAQKDLLYDLSDNELRAAAEREYVYPPIPPPRADVPNELVKRILGVEQVDGTTPHSTRKQTKLMGITPEGNSVIMLYSGSWFTDAPISMLDKRNRTGVIQHNLLDHEVNCIQTYTCDAPETETFFDPECQSDYAQTIQYWRTKYLRLAAEIAFRMGGPTGMHTTITYGADLVPEDLTRDTHDEVTWIRGGPTTREGFGAEAILGSKTNITFTAPMPDGGFVMETEDDVFVLRSGSQNGLVPWVPTFYKPTTGIRTAEQLAREMELSLFF